jgi:hypothetical protein
MPPFYHISINEFTEINLAFSQNYQDFCFYDFWEKHILVNKRNMSKAFQVILKQQM